MNIYAVAVAIAFAVGVASGAGVQEYRIKNIRLEAAEKLAKGWENADRIHRELQKSADRIRNQSVRRVRCESTSPSVPPSDSSSALGDLSGVGTSRDYGPALRELLAGAAQLNKLAGEGK